MIEQTETLSKLQQEFLDIQKLRAIDLAIPEFLDVYEFKEPDKKKYFKKKKVELRDYYLAYVHNRNKEEKVIQFDYIQFKEFCLLFNNTMGLYISQTGNWLKFPLGLGLFGISKFMPRYYKPKYTFTKKKTINEQGEEVEEQVKGIELNPNQHTLGYVAKFSWDKSEAKLMGKGSFRHMATTNLKRYMYQSIVNLRADTLYHTISREDEKLTKAEITKAKQKTKGDKIENWDKDKALAKAKKELKIK